MSNDTDDRFPIVALGGSAGGIEAFFRFFEALEERGDPPGMAFIVILHLPPDRESSLPELLQTRTSLPVEAVERRTLIKPNHVYVIPPDGALFVRDGALDLHKRQEGPAHHPVDEIFESLAAAYGERAVAVVFSGSGSDGSAGLTKVWEAGGLVLAQTPETAGFTEMPHRAISTGKVDTALVPEEMPDALLRNADRLRRGKGLEAERTEAREATAAQERPEPGAEEEKDPFRRILATLRSRTSVDFSQYKEATLRRRIDRRAALEPPGDWEAYADRLRDSPEEAERLLDDLLISVTSFFRDREAWETLAEQVVKPLMRAPRDDRRLRIWVAGCATGEEAYSAAILLFEEARVRGASIPIEIFATDVSEKARARARQATYPAAAVKDLPEKWRTRWFENRDDVLRVKPELREAMVFAPHNLLQDPPFTGMDLILCRNLLIYLQPELQRRLIRLFHFALREGGHLFLGTAESIGEAGDDLFSVVDKTARIYRRVGQTRHDLVEIPIMRSEGHRETASDLPRQPERGPRRDIANRALRALALRHAPPSVLIDEKSNILYHHGQTDRYLKAQSGEPTQNLLALAREELAPHLRRLINKAGESGPPESTLVRVAMDGHTRSVRAQVAPVTAGGEDRSLLVSFLSESPPAGADGGAEPPLSSREQELEDEVATLRAELAAAQETSGRTEEEHKAYHEEITSMNEELRATNEELETSKEELQSVNEELSTVNSQLREKISALQERTADLNNLLESIDTATLFLDQDLCIRWFSPGIEALFNIRDADVHRPVSHLTRNFADESFEEDCRQVLKRLTPREAEVETAEGRSLLRRLSPYRTAEDRIAGVVATFSDVTEIQAQRKYAERIVETVPTPLIVLDTELRVVSANPAFYETFQVPPEKTEKRLIYHLGNNQWDIPELRRLLTEILPDDDVVKAYEVIHEFENIGERTMLLSGCRLDHVQLILLAIEDITERKRHEVHRELLMAELAHRVKNALAVVQSIATQTLESTGSLDEFRESFLGRLDAYARSHDQLMAGDWKETDLRELVQSTVEVHVADPSRVSIEGPGIKVSPKQALALGLVLHELETNATKYGALSTGHGEVLVRWRKGEDGFVHIHWREKDGPPVAEPREEGFGSTLIRQLVEYELGGSGTIEYCEEGLRCEISYPLSRGH